MTPAQRKNLKRLRAVIEEAPEDLLHMRALHEEARCGTAHCALGWAAVDPILGPKLMRGLDPTYSEARSMYDFWGMINDATPKVFGLDREDARRLFAVGIDGGSNPHAVKKSEVLWNIDELIAGRSALPYRSVVRHHKRTQLGWRAESYHGYSGPCARGLSA